MQTENPLITKAEESVEARVKPQDIDNFHKIIDNGLAIAFDPQMAPKMISGLKQSKDPIRDSAVAAVGVLLMLSRKAGGKFPISAAIPAGLILAMHGLDFIEKSGLMKITNAEIDKVTEAYSSTILPKLGITPDVLQKTLSQSGAAMQNPAVSSTLKKIAGV